MAFIDIKTQVLANVIDLPASVVAVVPKLINDAIRAAERRYNFKYMEGNLFFVTDPTGITSLGASTDFKEYLDRGPYVFQQFSKAYAISPVTNNGDANIDRVLNPAYPGRPRHIFNIMNGPTNTFQFYVLPAPDLRSDWPDGMYRIYIPYYKYSAPLVADTDTNWLVNNADDYIIEKATGEALKKDWDYNGAAVWFQSAENKFVEIRTTDKKLRLSGVTTLVPHWEGAKQGMVIR